jgi:dihydropteroate synthase
MGIINTTPDSFYDGGRKNTLSEIVSKAENMLFEGACFLDVGGYSSRPGADFVSETEELNRVLPAIKAIHDHFPKAIISIDTFRSTVAKEAVLAGASIINDISGGTMDDHMFETASNLQVPYIMMHMRGTPQTMSELTSYDSITRDLLLYFSNQLAKAKKIGINDIIADPGFGFAKTRQQNFELLNTLELFTNLDIPYLVGISRKSMIYKTLEVTSDEALNGTTVLNTVALMKGASILRVHDVKEAAECITLLQNLKSDS